MRVAINFTHERRAVELGKGDVVVSTNPERGGGSDAVLDLDPHEAVVLRI
jgi:hypothetical protein